jgi:glutaredoxin
MSEEKPGFTVKDRRIFAEKDEDVKNKEAEKEPPKQEAKEEAKKESVSAEEQKTEPKINLPEINFATFIISLNASALLHLGAMEDPASGKKVKNLPIGKQTIDILGMLEEKTKGNLLKEEENLLKNILYDLRMIYVKEQE